MRRRMRTFLRIVISVCFKPGVYRCGTVGYVRTLTVTRQSTVMAQDILQSGLPRVQMA